MEIAVFLTNSIGGIAVFACGVLFTYIVRKDDKKILDLQFLYIIFSPICAGTMFIMVRLLPAYTAILPVFVFVFLPFSKRLKNPVHNLSLYKNMKWITAGIFILFAAAMLYRTGSRPFYTYIERLIQISDGVKTIIKNSLGIGPGEGFLRLYFVVP